MRPSSGAVDDAKKGHGERPLAALSGTVRDSQRCYTLLLAVNTIAICKGQLPGPGKLSGELTCRIASDVMLSVGGLTITLSCDDASPSTKPPPTRVISRPKAGQKKKHRGLKTRPRPGREKKESQKSVSVHSWQQTHQCIDKKRKAVGRWAEEWKNLHQGCGFGWYTTTWNHSQRLW